MADAALKALCGYFNPMRAMKGGDASCVDIVLVLKSFDTKNMRAYCEQAASNLAIRDLSAKIVEYHSRGMKMSIFYTGQTTLINLIFTGDMEALPDGKPDPYLLGFYTVEQKKQFEQLVEKHGPGLEDVVQSVKTAARGKGFKDYFLELICILEFEENLSASALRVAQEHLVDQKLRTVKCPVTGMTVHVRGQAADAEETEGEIASLMAELKSFKFVDTDGSGSVSMDELMKALEAQGMNDAAAKAGELLTKYDVGGDGMLQEDEYKKLFTEIFATPSK